MVKKFVFLLLISLVAAIPLSGCRADNSLDTASPTHLPEVSQTHTPSPTSLASAKPTSEPTATPEPTLAPTPIGAGLITPEIEFVLDTPLEDIEPGEYLFVLDTNASQPEGELIIQYVSWDARVSGPFFHMASANEISPRLTIRSGVGGRLWIEVNDPPGMLVVDLPSLQTRMFSFGNDCHKYIRSKYIGETHFTFECMGATSESMDILFFVSNERWGIVGSWTYTEDIPISNWLSDQLVFSTSWRGGPSFQYCIVEPPEWLMNCQQLPYSIGNTSLISGWMWVSPGYQSDQGPFRGMPLAILPRECTGVESESCQPIQISRPSVWLDEEPIDFTYPAWSPSGEELAILDVACVGGPSDTWIWYYDLKSGESKKLTSLDGCYEFPFYSVIWSPDGQRFVVNGNPFDDEPIVILLEGSPVSYPLPFKGWVVGTFQIP